jgi:hypothetical protein
MFSGADYETVKLTAVDEATFDDAFTVWRTNVDQAIRDLYSQGSMVIEAP